MSGRTPLAGRAAATACRPAGVECRPSCRRASYSCGRDRTEGCLTADELYNKRIGSSATMLRLPLTPPTPLLKHPP